MLSQIRRVDIEYQSYCNRKCPWCPNITFNRDHKTYMSDEMYSKIIKELQSYNFGTAERRAVISFLGYEEPLSNAELFKKRVEQAWDSLPNNVELLSNTNGDYLTKDSLDGLLLTKLNIMDYDSKGMEYWKTKMEEAGVVIVNMSGDQISGAHRYVDNINCFCNWPQHAALEDRGGFFKQGDLSYLNWKNNMEIRTVLCVEPSNYINIDYAGNVMPCCHIRSDNPNHKEYILGNVEHNTLSEIYYSDKAINFRQLLSVDNGIYPDPCKHCQKTRR